MEKINSKKKCRSTSFSLALFLRQYSFSLLFDFFLFYCHTHLHAKERKKEEKKAKLFRLYLIVCVASWTRMQNCACVGFILALAAFGVFTLDEGNAVWDILSQFSFVIVIRVIRERAKERKERGAVCICIRHSIWAAANFLTMESNRSQSKINLFFSLHLLFRCAVTDFQTK